MIDVKLRKVLNGHEGDLWLDVAFQLQTGETLALYGPSGAGKTSILRMVAGHMKADGGAVQVDSQHWYDGSKGIFLPARKRNLGVVFQDYALFPHMTAAANIHFGKRKNQPNEEVDQLLEMMELKGLEDTYPQKLSGGQQQRIAIARALVSRPSLLMLDEPFSAMDQALKEKLRFMLKEIQQKFNTSILIVSHDHDMISTIADKVIVLDRGKILKQGNPNEILGPLKHHQGLTLWATVLDIEIDQDTYLLKLQFGNQIIELETSSDQAQQWNIGDKIPWTANA
ncbi:MAG: ABC transporter ATP-binding protein [Bacteroidota bacterium]